MHSFTARMPLLATTDAFGFREKTLTFSSTIDTTLSPYLVVLCQLHCTRLTALVRDYPGEMEPEW